MRIVIFSLITLLLGSFHFLKEAPKEVAQEELEIYDFKVTDLKGEIFDFATLKGKKNNDCKYSLKMWVDSTVQRVANIV